MNELMKETFPISHSITRNDWKADKFEMGNVVQLSALWETYRPEKRT